MYIYVCVEMSSWENHQTKHGIFRETMFDYRRVYLYENVYGYGYLIDACACVFVCKHVMDFRFLSDILLGVTICHKEQ